MAFITFMRSPAGRITRVALGGLLLFYGAQDDSLMGLMLMIVGLVPVVTGVTGVCLLEEIAREYGRRRGEPTISATQPSGRRG
jgi:hypothetical protein